MTKEEVEKNIAKKLKYYSYEQFEKDAVKYIEAIQEGRMVCVIHSVAKSGMSRVMSFHSCESVSYLDSNSPKSLHYRQYNCLFTALGHTESKCRNGFRISGCGMDMCFATNYNIIHNLHRLGFITKEVCNVLAQKTPTVL
mgnify:FL=1